MPIPSSDTPGVERRLLRDEAHDAIRDAILDGTFAPGETLDDTELQRWLGISRSPIREALTMLRLEGLIEVHAQKHTRVADPRPGDVEDSLQAVGAVMGGVMRITAPALSDEGRDRVIALIDDAVDAVAAADGRAHMRVGLQIYETLLDDCPNQVLEKLARGSLLALTFRYRSTIDIRIPNWDLLSSGWRRVRDGLLDGDNVAAELAFEEMHRLPLPTQQWDAAAWRPRPQLDAG
ncbi:MAG: hypothetical protein CVT61_01865 [Actinobacteria bacterium HGW-Actinobacteria-11]|nr:MAG: hypothetical protein CVT61_01865 [Actinobacteria bacterium HGW-Actinobacteria-11]